MKAEIFSKILGSEFYTGVPDSLLKGFCDYLTDKYGTDGQSHVIAANEGNAVGIAAGYHLATGKFPVVYMQNSGEGNAINPIASLLNDKVYGIPVIFVIGWRGEPGVKDEPQHIYQGEVTLKLLEDMNIASFVVDNTTGEKELTEVMNNFSSLLALGKQVAFIVRKGAITYDKTIEFKNDAVLLREDIIRHIVSHTDNDPIVSTTGKASRELFEIREENNEGHGHDFLTVGSMGHSSSIALGIAIQRKDKKVWIIDGDGAVLMHMGAMAVLGSKKPKNIVHIVINNGAHETVGGQPTAAGNIDLVTIARGCGYEYAVRVTDADSLDRELILAKSRNALSFIEVSCAIGARDNLGRPTTTAKENKEAFVAQLRK
ncbi:MAG: phosphonopyruvate decarboxylase [Clostridia bacterium]|nr:phosphonopyruvate decarboxylase [Clostridia bacterium]